MARFAELDENGVVVSIYNTDDYQAASRFGWVGIADNVEIGWRDGGDTYFYPPYATVGKYRFMFELFAQIEQLFLDASLKEAEALTPAQMLDPEMDERTAALVTLRNARLRFDALEVIELGDAATVAFLNACGVLGTFGPDPALAPLRIAEIQANTLAPDLRPEEAPAEEVPA